MAVLQVITWVTGMCTFQAPFHLLTLGHKGEHPAATRSPHTEAAQGPGPGTPGRHRAHRPGAGPWRKAPYPAVRPRTADKSQPRARGSPTSPALCGHRWPQEAWPTPARALPPSARANQQHPGAAPGKPWTSWSKPLGALKMASAKPWRARSQSNPLPRGHKSRISSLPPLPQLLLPN